MKLKIETATPAVKGDLPNNQNDVSARRRERPPLTAERARPPRLWTRKRERPELESYDEYFRVITQLDETTRVIACRDGIQWIVQRARGQGSRRMWAGVSFCRSKEALLRCVREWAPGEHPALAALPDWFPEARAKPATSDDACWQDWPPADDAEAGR
jgi:hypothetical protein